MPPYCKKCNGDIGRVGFVIVHAVNCHGLDSIVKFLTEQGKPGQYDLKSAGKKLCEASPMAVFEHFYTTIDPMSARVIMHSKARDVIWDALFCDGVRPSVQTKLIVILQDLGQLGKFQHADFSQRITISGLVESEMVYYRKMSNGEFDASQKSEKNPFEAAFKYTDKPNYRYWVSSSLKKVNMFGNENASDAGGVVVKMVFKVAPVKFFKIAAHQMKGVQTTPGLVAIHREGFAEIGSVGTDLDVQEIVQRQPMLDHNLGFTSAHSKDLANQLTSFERL